MKFLITTLLGLLYALNAAAGTFDFVYGQPGIVLNNGVNDRSEWAYGKPAATLNGFQCVLNQTADTYISSQCYISSNQTSQGIIRLIESGQLSCIDGAVIEAKGLTGTKGTKFTARTSCKLELWRPN